jgi:hypothetical protein
MINLKVKAFVEDAQARLEIKNMIGHSGYFSCERCIKCGIFSSGHVVLDEINCVSTNESYRNRSHEDHHRYTAQDSPMLDLNLDM